MSEVEAQLAKNEEDVKEDAAGDDVDVAAGDDTAAAKKKKNKKKNKNKAKGTDLQNHMSSGCR